MWILLFLISSQQTAEMCTRQGMGRGGVGGGKAETHHWNSHLKDEANPIKSL